ncbi:MAG TPA: TraR/DksA C4-type zinc finger protein [Polyangia bacterium]|jgi:DnaK suppressor protein|nr:TraR/DksA C4-type zinc finger protein [Polyangia bacterium]
MLNESQKTQLRTVLEAERARLIENAKDGLQFSMNRERNIGRDSIDESMEEEIFSTELRLRDREKFLLGKIDGSLRRLDEGIIDECEDCAEAIGFKRLLARPVTTLCIDCKEEREKEEATQAQTAGRSGSVSRDEIGGGEELGGGSED